MVSALTSNLVPHLFLLFQADVRDEEALLRAFEGVDCVFHVASHGMSGAEKVSPSRAAPRGPQSGVRPWLCRPAPRAEFSDALHPSGEVGLHPAYILRSRDQMPVLPRPSCVT